MTDREAILCELDALMRDTYQLWDEGWVGFSWRNYTYDHVQRVRRLALSLAAEEGADLHALDVAAVLHDITKSYDGEVLMRDGQRIVDEQGFWRNEYLPPARTNTITRMYDELDLAGTVHNISGAHIARTLLAERGYDTGFRDHVAEIIVSHLKVTDATSLEGRCLYDADTIDANIGHPALYRNIQISMHFLERQHADRGESTQEYLSHRLRDHVQDYIVQRWPTWISGKHRDFVERMTTEAGRRRALARIGRLEETLATLQAELDEFDAAIDSGYLAPIVHFIHNRDNPSLSEELDRLHERWPAHHGYPAGNFLSILHQESLGVL